MKPWEFLQAISHNKKYLIKDNEADYVPFFINRTLSFYVDTLLYANEMNRYNALEPKLQHDYLFHSIPAKKRYFKTSKKTKADENVELIMNYYGYNKSKALQVLPMMTEERMKKIREQLETGGVAR